MKGQKAAFAIKMNEIKERVLPELNDEFVKKATRFSTVDELKADIKEYLEKQRESLKKTSAENAVFKAITDATSINIPQSMINREVNAIANDYRQRLSYQGVNWTDFIQSQGGEVKFGEALADEAKVRIKNSLIIDKISKEEKLTVEKEDFTGKLSQLSAAYGATPDAIVKQFGQNPQFINSLSQQIINDKVREFLIENNKFEYVEVKPEKAEAPKAEKAEKKETKAKKTAKKDKEKEAEA